MCLRRFFCDWDIGQKNFFLPFRKKILSSHRKRFSQIILLAYGKNSFSQKKKFSGRGGAKLFFVSEQKVYFISSIENDLFFTPRAGGIIFFSEPEKNYLPPPPPPPGGEKETKCSFFVLFSKSISPGFFLVDPKKTSTFALFFSPKKNSPHPSALFLSRAQNFSVSEEKNVIFENVVLPRKKKLFYPLLPGRAKKFFITNDFSWGGENFEKTFARKNEFFFLGKKLFSFDRGRGAQAYNGVFDFNLNLERKI